MNTAKYVPYTYRTRWSKIETGRFETIEIIRGLWMAYVIQRKQEYLDIIQRIIEVSPEEITHTQADNYVIKQKPTKTFETLMSDLEKETNMRFWIEAFDKILSLGTEGLHVLKNTGACNEIETFGFQISPYSSVPLVIRSLISGSQFSNDHWFRINYSNDLMQVLRLSKSPVDTLSLPPIRATRATIYLIMRTTGAFVWYFDEKETEQIGYG